MLTVENFNVRINLELQSVQLYEIWAKKLEATHPLAGPNPRYHYLYYKYKKYAA